MGFFDFLRPKNIMVDQSNVQTVQSVQTGVINDSGGLEFVVEDVFAITGRGTVVTGRVMKGVVAVGDEVTISPSGVKTVVTGIEQFRKTSNFAQEGENAGLLLRNVSREQVKRGYIIVR